MSRGESEPWIYHLRRRPDARVVAWKDHGGNQPCAVAIGPDEGRQARAALGYDYGRQSVSTWSLARDLLRDVTGREPAAVQVLDFTDEWLVRLGYWRSHELYEGEIRAWLKHRGEGG